MPTDLIQTELERGTVYSTKSIRTHLRFRDLSDQVFNDPTSLAQPMPYAGYMKSKERCICKMTKAEKRYPIQSERPAMECRRIRFVLFMIQRQATL